jgi:hypothetical protein
MPGQSESGDSRSRQPGLFPDHRRRGSFVHIGGLLDVNSTQHGKNECLQEADQQLKKVEWEREQDQRDPIQGRR